MEIFLVPALEVQNLASPPRGGPGPAPWAHTCLLELTASLAGEAGMLMTACALLVLSTAS